MKVISFDKTKIKIQENLKKLFNCDVLEDCHLLFKKDNFRPIFDKYNGYSCIIDPYGEHCVEMTEDETIIYYQLNKSKIIDIRNSLNFLNDKDDFTLKF